MSSAAFPALASVSSIDFVSTNSKKDLQSLSAKGFDFVYYEKKGTYFLMQMDQKRALETQAKVDYLLFLKVSLS